MTQLIYDTIECKESNLSNYIRVLQFLNVFATLQTYPNLIKALYDRFSEHQGESSETMH